VGYGNLGKGVRRSIGQNPDMELVAIFTRRDVGSVVSGDPLMVPYANIKDYKGKVDVMILCGGSATDLEVQGPEVAAHFKHTVDSFDTHARIPEYFEKMNSTALKPGR
jgi:diaminopimelate dehydrogenase